MNKPQPKALCKRVEVTVAVQQPQAVHNKARRYVSMVLRTMNPSARSLPKFLAASMAKTQPLAEPGTQGHTKPGSNERRHVDPSQLSLPAQDMGSRARFEFIQSPSVRQLHRTKTFPINARIY